MGEQLPGWWSHPGSFIDRASWSGIPSSQYSTVPVHCCSATCTAISPIHTSHQPVHPIRPSQQRTGQCCGYRPSGVMEIVGGSSSLAGGGATAGSDEFPPSAVRTGRLRPDSASKRSAPGPQALHYSHPSHARTFYKLVFLSEDCTMPLSIHNRTTRYSLGSTLVQSGAPSYGEACSECIQNCNHCISAWLRIKPAALCPRFI